jgi:hypothetical protein
MGIADTSSINRYEDSDVDDNDVGDDDEENDEDEEEDEEEPEGMSLHSPSRPSEDAPTFSCHSITTWHLLIRNSSVQNSC